MCAASGLEVATIGHSNLLLVEFIAHLHANQIATVVDVRSTAASRMCPWFSRGLLPRALADEGIDYVFMGDRLGGRPQSRSLYLPNGKPDYVLFARTSSYLSGISDLLALAAGRRVALMCSEGDFRRCHRQTLIGRTLRERRVALSHILRDGSIVSDPPEQLAFFDALF